MPRKVLIDKNTLQEILAKYQGGGSSAGGSGGIDTIVMATTYSNTQAILELVFNSNAGELEKHKDALNQGIQAINTQAGTSIPLMTDLDSLSDVLDYLNTLNNDTIYNNAMKGFFSWLSNYCISSGIRLNTNNVTNVSSGFFNTHISVDTNGYEIVTVGSSESEELTLTGSGFGQISGSADGEDSTGNAISLPLMGDATVDVTVTGSVPTAGAITWASASQNSKFSSLTVVKGSSSSGGSGTSNVLHKHTISGLVDSNQLGTYTISFLSKYNQVFANGESLSNFLTNIQATQDEQVMISPEITLTREGTTMMPSIVNGYEINLVTNGLDISSGTEVIEFLFADNTNITDTVTPYIQVSGGSGSSVELPKYYEISIYVSSQNSGSNEKMLFNISESNLNVFIDTANQQLSAMGYTLTKDNWSTLIPQLGTASSQLRHALIKGLLTLSNNASAEDIDGYSNMIYVSASGEIKLGYDVGVYTTIESSSIRLITNYF